MNVGKDISWREFRLHGSIFSLKYSTKDVEGCIGDYFRSCAENKNYLVELPEIDVVAISIENYFEEN